MKAFIYAIVVDDVVKYIGKGTGRRAIRHVQKMHQILRARAAGEVVQATHLHNRMAKAWRNGSMIEIEILIDGLTDDAAFAKEIEVIATYPAWQLWNKTLGGDRPPDLTGHPASPERIAKARASNLKSWSDPNLLAEQSKRMKVTWLKPEYREQKIAQNSRPQPTVSEKAKLRWADPEFKAKMDRIHNDPMRKEKRSEAGLCGWETRRARQK
jgi:hypothetical protein